MTPANISTEFLVSHLTQTYDRLTNTVRYSTNPKITHETVASHSFFVAYISMMLCDYLKLDLDVEKVLRMALIHDVEESVSGDIIYTMKHRDNRFAEEVERMNETIIREIYQDLCSYVEFWEEYKAGKTPEASVVDIADRISGLLYLLMEGKLGNKTALEIFIRTLDVIRSKDMLGLEAVIQEFDRIGC